MALIRVRYKGIADRRIISKQDWAEHGIEVSQDLEWNARNKFTVVVDATDRVEQVLRDQGHFTISKVTDAGSEVAVAEATDTQSEGDVLVDGDTGASTEAKKATAAKKNAEAQAPQSSGSAAPTTSGAGSSTTGGGTAGNGSSTAGA